MKVDFEKAFDSLNWNYLDSIMEHMGFSCKYRGWIQGCLTSAGASVLVNGSPTEEFPITKGVRPGDPLSSFLFIIVMEGLNIALKSALKKTSSKVLPCPIMVLLYFTYSMLMMQLWWVNGASKFSQVTFIWHWCDGIKATFSSSSDRLPQELITFQISWSVGGCKYGLRLSTWKANTLSFAGRLTLNKSILNMSWTKVVASKKDGDLEVGTLKAQNMALLTKWWWKLYERTDNLWKDCIKSIHNLQRKSVTVIAKASTCGVCSNIAKIIKALIEVDINYYELFTLMPGSNSIGFRWCWKSHIMEKDVMDDLANLCDMLFRGSIRNQYKMDFDFNVSANGRYNVCTLHNKIDLDLNPCEGYKICWLKAIPLKIRCFVWRAAMNKILVATNLEDRRVIFQSNICPLCDMLSESCDLNQMQC
uniref:Reverse transcriptase zinc-binding domain-containing protein n=1 Tax=Lactuca sativa TaxID=4236 RepID=A0A9R1VWQ3_LACSA|nr:hypothetical protein LSAT_V11C400160660 [Lactuca sativa]